MNHELAGAAFNSGPGLVIRVEKNELESEF